MIRRVVLGVFVLAVIAVVAGILVQGVTGSDDVHHRPRPNEINRSAAPWGITVKSGADLEKIVQRLGYTPVYAMWFDAWGDGTGNFNAGLANEIAAQGSIPVVTWEPKAVGSKGAAVQESYLPGIISGNWDAYIKRYAQEVADHKGEVVMRFAHEANLRVYSWGVNSHGNTGQDYIEAWRHVVRIFREEGATNAKWFWTPNAPFPGVRAQMDEFYPGDHWVDMVGVDGYNWGRPRRRWKSPQDVFLLGVEQIEKIAPDKPNWIGEMGCAEGATPEAKAGWIRDFFDLLATNHNLDGFIWFDKNIPHHRDWRLDTSPEAFQAFRQGLHDFERIQTTNLIKGGQGQFENGSTTGWSLNTENVRPKPGITENVLPAQGTGYFRGTAQPDPRGPFLTKDVPAESGENLVASVHVGSSVHDHDYRFILRATPLGQNGRALSDAASASVRGDWTLRYLATRPFVTPQRTHSVRFTIAVRQRGAPWGTVFVDDARLTTR